MDCLFCKIATGSIETPFIYADDTVAAFKDINPQAPHHIIIIPKNHFSTLNDLDVKDSATISHLFLAATKIAKDLKLDDSGYRLVMNCNADGGQTIYHVHLHLLGGRQFYWPPG